MDLEEIFVVERQRRFDDFRIGGNDAAVRIRERLPDGPAEPRFTVFILFADAFDVPLFAVLFRFDKIGRASCRERV